jgi:ABC-2 type transport system ATP-binding protein
MIAIDCLDLTKTYARRVTALHEITLQITAGSSFGLLGENGAGKSTLVRILMGFIHPTTGSIRVLEEHDVIQAHSHIGYVPENPVFEPRFSARTYLLYMAQLIGHEKLNATARVNDVLETVQLGSVADRQTRTYSKGMLQRLAIAQALLGQPDLLILDEPTSGLDPRSQWEVRQVIRQLRGQGTTLFICSHYLTEVEELCDTVGILRRGRLILNSSVQQLLTAQDVVEITISGISDAESIIKQLGLRDDIISAHHQMLRIRSSDQQHVLAALVQAEIPIISLSPLHKTLEEIYVQTTRTDEQKVPTPVTIGEE